MTVPALRPKKVAIVVHQEHSRPGRVGALLEKRGYDVYDVSAASHAGLRELSFAMAAIVARRRDEAPALARTPFAAAAQGQLGNNGTAQLDRLESANNYDDRVGIVRGFTRENPARAALAVRDMIKADAR